MSNLNNLTSKILANAEAKKEAILASAQAEKQAIVEKYEGKAARETAAIYEQAIREAETAKERMISRATLKARDELLAAKQEKIQTVFQMAIQQLNNMDEATFQTFLTTAVEKMSFQGEVNLILGAAAPVQNIASTISNINKNIASRGQKIVLHPERKVGMVGFILEQNGVEMNCSFEALVNFVKDEMEYEVATVLFSGKEKVEHKERELVFS